MAWIYFVRCGSDGPIKIGKTLVDPLARVATLQQANWQQLQLLAVIHLGDRGGPSDWKMDQALETRLTQLEREIHGAFDAERLRGEWFKATEDLLDFIKQHADSSFGRSSKEDRLRAVMKLVEGDS